MTYEQIEQRLLENTLEHLDYETQDIELAKERSQLANQNLQMLGMLANTRKTYNDIDEMRVKIEKMKLEIDRASNGKKALVDRIDPNVVIKSGLTLLLGLVALDVERTDPILTKAFGFVKF